MSLLSKFSLQEYMKACGVVNMNCGRIVNTDRNLYKTIFTKLALEKQYPDTSKLQVVELYPAVGMSSLAFHEVYKPKLQVLMEPKLSFGKLIKSHLELISSIKLYPKHPYLWESFISLIEDKTIVVEKQSRDHIHDSFLIMGNLTDKSGEQLYMQYLQCVGNRNWLQRFGLVRMLFWVRHKTAIKILAPLHSGKRSRCSLMTEAFTNTKLVATTDQNIKEYDERVLKEHDPVIFSDQKDDYALVEICPKEHNIDLDNWDYCIQRLMIMRSTPLRDTLEILGHGASEYLRPRLKDTLLSLRPMDLTVEDFSTIAREFANWPFKPTSLIDFYEPTEDH
ncbi:HBL352Cp [Eremothecium sinecaudum]|uniref:rRNA adenine N(6)-methyltransferase n=1 Tax=Eremothecium sinecaudum TaxID=45286 RepID=A0A125RDT6_9SACH|nr:HBL352Cp [Eremothecium sinecaudum]AMD18550.1 HBL352Cp [Eremothecium sinecaudum]